MNEQIAATTRIVEDVISRGKLACEEMIKAGQEQAEKAAQTLKTSIEEAKDLTQKNADALVASSTIMARGVEEAGKEMVALSKKNAETSVEIMQKLAKVTTVTEAVELQQGFARSCLASMVAETERMSAMITAVARNAMMPINDRVNATVALMTRPIAA